jgi:hypothetical protein
MSSHQVTAGCSSRFKNPVISSMAGFLTDIDLIVKSAAISHKTFLGGLLIKHGELWIDESRLAYPGDVLHEAGHLAILPPRQRQQLNENVGNDGGQEMAAIAWSYAAALHLGLDPAIVFHPDGYKGGAQAILDNFAQGRYVGVPYLEWLGMTIDRKKAILVHAPPYPHMLKWLNDEPLAG